MGNELSRQSPDDDEKHKQQKPAYAEFFASAGKTIGQASGVVCGSLSDTIEENDVVNLTSNSKFKRSNPTTFKDPEDDESLQSNPMSQLFARALLNEVTDNPSTMTPLQMAEREKKLLKAQRRAHSASKEGLRAIGGQGTFKQHLQGASQRIIPPSVLSEHRAQVLGNGESSDPPRSKHSVTIGLMLSRRDPTIGHPDTVTRQSAFDFNELQDRNYRYVSSTDASGWRAGGGESGEPSVPNDNNISTSLSEEDEFDKYSPSKLKAMHASKIPAPDTVHIPIIHINCESEASVNSVIAALARGEVFIPHMSVMPEALGVNGISPPDLVVRFGCERNDDFPPEEWPNWCLEFMHNQLYEYFSDVGARWMKRPFQITLAKKVRWKTVKHMNKFFAHSETVINSWREKGPQYLDPLLTHIDGGATPEEVARPHGIYLLRDGKPTNYFAPNFEPPYTTKMTRSLLLNVISKSWDKKRRDWSTGPISNVTPSLLFSTMCGCAEPNDGGFIAREVTNHFSPIGGGTFFGDRKYEHDLAFNISSNDNRILLENLKITRDDSGITRSQIGNIKTMDYDRNLSNGAKFVGTSATAVVSKSTSSDAFSGTDDPTEKQISSSAQRIAAFADESEMNNQSHDEDDEENDVVHNLRNSASYKEENFTPPKKLQVDGPAYYETPLINNRNSNGEQYNSKEAHSRMLHDTYLSKQNAEPLSAVYRKDSLTQNGGHAMEGQLNNSATISVGESQTTVPIMNRSSAFIESEREMRKQRELEREKERKKIDELEQAIQEKLRLQEDKKKQYISFDAEPVTEQEYISDSKRKSKKEKKVKKEKKKRDKKDRREKDHSRSNSAHSTSTADSADKWDQIATHGAQQGQSMPYSSFKENRENRKLESDPVDSYSPFSGPPIKPASFDKNSNATRDNSYFQLNLQNPAANQKWSQNVFIPQSPASGNNLEINSAASMDYSMDTASLLGDGSLIGGQFAGDSSVFTMGTSASDNKSLLSCVTRSTVHDMNTSNRKRIGAASAQPVDDDASLSLVASNSNGGATEAIPSDDDLFAIGWAKALDPRSGCYYYFTLDRSKTVWENPLSTHDI